MGSGMREDKFDGVPGFAPEYNQIQIKRARLIVHFLLLTPELPLERLQLR